MEKYSEESEAAEYYDFELAQKEQENSNPEMKPLEYFMPERSKSLLILKIIGSFTGVLLAIAVGYIVVDAVVHIMNPLNDWPIFVTIGSAFTLIAIVCLWFFISGLRSLLSLEYRWEKMVIAPDEILLFLDKKQKPIKIQQDEIDRLSVLFRYKLENNMKYDRKTDKLFLKIFLKNGRRYSLGSIFRDLNQFVVKREHDILRKYLAANFEVSDKEMNTGDILFGIFIVIGIVILVIGLSFLGIYIARII